VANPVPIQPALREILRALLGEVQHLRVDQAVMLARLSGKASPVDLLDIEKSARAAVVTEHKQLVAKIDGLS
jgi:hypothetical protein